MGPSLPTYLKISTGLWHAAYFKNLPCLLEFRHKPVNSQKPKKNKLTPHVVMTGSLKTLQHNWQHSFTEGCSAKTWGSYRQTQTSGHISNPRRCSCYTRCVCAGCHTVSSSSSCKEKVERRDMLDSEWRERTEMAESDLRGVPMGGWGEHWGPMHRSQSVMSFQTFLLLY